MRISILNMDAHRLLEKIEPMVDVKPLPLQVGSNMEEYEIGYPAPTLSKWTELLNALAKFNVQLDGRDPKELEAVAITEMVKLMEQTQSQKRGALPSPKKKSKPSFMDQWF